MQSRPDEFDERLLETALAERWRFEATAVEYAPVGFGSYHWIVTSPRGDRVFATVDDLDRKPWLGDTRDAAFDGLRRAFDAAAALREHGLEFVVAPLRTPEGATVCRVGPRHSLAVFPFVEGESGSFGDDAPLGTLLAELHAATEAVAVIVRPPARPEVETTITASNAGPFSEPVRRLLAQHEADVARLVDEYARLSAAVADNVARVTHGEPHAGNVIRTDDGLALVDWDTVALAPVERDLWMLSARELARYAELTGHEPDRDALELYRLAWDLDDLAAYLSTFRSPHEESEDTRAEYDHLTRLLQSPSRPGG